MSTVCPHSFPSATVPKAWSAFKKEGLKKEGEKRRKKKTFHTFLEWGGHLVFCTGGLSRDGDWNKASSLAQNGNQSLQREPKWLCHVPERWPHQPELRLQGRDRHQTNSTMSSFSLQAMIIRTNIYWNASFFSPNPNNPKYRHCIHGLFRLGLDSQNHTAWPVLVMTTMMTFTFPR